MLGLLFHVLHSFIKAARFYNIRERKENCTVHLLINLKKTENIFCYLIPVFFTDGSCFDF